MNLDPVNPHGVRRAFGSSPKPRFRGRLTVNHASTEGGGKFPRCPLGERYSRLTSCPQGLSRQAASTRA